MTGSADPIRLLIDTDIGSDIDDEFALAMIWGSPEIEFVGLSASYGDVELRTRIARRMASLADRPILAVPGDATTRSGREIWWAGHEGAAYQPLDTDPIDVGTPSAGARLIAEAGVASGDTAPHLLAIGPLGTVASAFDLAPELTRTLAGLWVMGGDFADGPPEHNILSDVDAAKRVLESDAAITLVPVDITRRVKLFEPDIARIEATGELGRILAAQARDWMRRWDEDFELPHDPLTLLALLEPRHFTFSESGRLSVEGDPESADYGRTSFTPGEGRHRIVTDVAVDAAAAAIADRIARGLLPLAR